MTWVWTMMIAMLMVPPTVVVEPEAPSDGLSTVRSAGLYRTSAVGEELW